MVWVAWLMTSVFASEPTGDPAATMDVAATSMIAQAVAAHGLADRGPTEIRFGFRDVPYTLVIDGPRYRYQRRVSTGAGARVDTLVGAAFTSTLAGRPLSLPPDQAGALERSLNSVAYFALLPRPLQDGAVRATSLGTTTLRGAAYDTLEVRFRQEGGGADHDDVFRYWFHPNTHEIAYLAYAFHTGRGGARVRRVIRRHEVGGLVLLDYANHGRDGAVSLDEAVAAFEAGTLPQLSTIALTNVQVTAAEPLP